MVVSSWCLMLVLGLVSLLMLPNLLTGAHVHGGHKERSVDGGLSPKSREHTPHHDHQAILGNKKEAEEFDHLPPEESKKRLRVLANRMDVDKDGFVDILELKKWILQSFITLAQEEGKERFHEEDLNNDGKVTWEEHLKDAFDINIITDYEELNDPENKQLMEEDRALWRAADKDGDDYLNIIEFPAFNSPEEYESMKEVLLELTMVRRDKDKDGFLSLHEFMMDEQGEVPDKNSANYISEKDKFDKEFDENQDGKLNRREILSWIVPNNEDMAEEEAEHLLLSSDEDDDEKLSIQEIVNHHDIFVGSEATDFGQKLKSMKHDEL